MSCVLFCWRSHWAGAPVAHPPPTPHSTLALVLRRAYYSFYLPVACALILSGHASEAKLAASKEILLVMGEYFQVQVRRGARARARKRARERERRRERA